MLALVLWGFAALLPPAATGDLSFTGPTNYGVGTLPSDVGVGDFNGDSDPDLAVANRSSNNVSIRLGAAGGTFTTPTNYGVGTLPTGVAVGDFDETSRSS